MKELLKKKSIKIALLLIVAAVIAVIVGMNVQSAQKKKEYNAHIEAAEKYLTELDYEQAIAEYTLALEIEPNAEEVLDGLEKTYLAYADALVESGDYEKAIQILNEGYAQTGRESLQEKLAQIQEKMEQEEKFQSYVQQVYDLMVAEDYEHIEEVFVEMAQLEDLDSWLQEGAHLYFPEENETQTGIGAGCYPLHDWHFVNGAEEADYVKQFAFAFYYGDYVDGKREGQGVSFWWRSRFYGEWKNDAPNGYGELKGGYTSDCLTVSGNLIDGLWDGVVTRKEEEIIWSGTNKKQTGPFVFYFRATKGIPENRTEEYLTELENFYGFRGTCEHGDSYIYTYSDIFETVLGEEDYACLNYRIKYGETIGVWGFANVRE